MKLHDRQSKIEGSGVYFVRAELKVKKKFSCLYVIQYISTWKCVGGKRNNSPKVPEISQHLQKIY